jgi:cyclopropane fatty-acyl-phospholipid synthase-like methyltransferase
MQSQWEDFYKSHNYFHLQPHEALKALVSKCTQQDFSRVLDLGCGAGTDLLYLAEKGFEVTGVDFSPSAASNAEDLLQSKGFTGKIYIDNLFDKITTFKPGEFDAVIAIKALEYTDDETLFVDAISQVADVLVENGLFLLVITGQEAKADLEVEAQLFLEEEQISTIVSRQFNILDLSRDNENNYVFMLQKKNTNNH